MERRKFITGTGVAVAAVVLPMATLPASAPSKNWRRIADETNTFGPNDTLEVRLEKFNELTRMNLRVCGPNPDGLHCFVYTDNRYTGWMDEETMMHWTAQVGLGYRLAKAQGL